MLWLISVKNHNYESYKNPPTNPDQYKQPQVLINSDRLVFNAKTDSILLSAEKSIFLGTTNEDSSVNIQSQKTVISELNKIAMIHLYSHGYEGEELLDFDLITSKKADMIARNYK